MGRMGGAPSDRTGREGLSLELAFERRLEEQEGLARQESRRQVMVSRTLAVCMSAACGNECF